MATEIGVDERHTPMSPEISVEAEEAKAAFGSDAKAGYSVIEQKHIIPEGGERVTTTWQEYWSYCLYNWGGTGVGVGNYGGALQQALVDGEFPDGNMTWGGQQTTTTAFILDLNGIIFAVQLVVLILTGPYADYGTWRPWILIFWTVVGIATSFAFLAATDSSQWALGAGLYVISNIALNMANTFWTAPFPTLVRDMAKMQESEVQVVQGTKSAEEHAKLDMLERSLLSNWSYMFEYVGSFLSILLCYAISYGIGYATPAQNNMVYAVVAAYFGGIWILTSIPWFWYDQRRPGQKLPDNTSWLTVGPKQIWEAAKNVARLKQTFLYILAYFLITDALVTSGNIIQILQNSSIQFDTFTYNGLYATVYAASGVGQMIQILIQRRYGFTPRSMFIYNTAAGLIYCLWGIFGVYTDKVGYHNAYNGLFTGGNFSYAAVCLAEVTPAPKMYLFFCLFNTVGKTSTFIGPFITGAIIDAAGGNTNVAFYFTFFTGLVGLAILCCVNVNKSKADNAAYLAKEREDLYASYGGTEVSAAVLQNNHVVKA